MPPEPVNQDQGAEPCVLAKFRKARTEALVPSMRQHEVARTVACMSREICQTGPVGCPSRGAYASIFKLEPWQDYRLLGLFSFQAVAQTLGHAALFLHTGLPR